MTTPRGRHAAATATVPRSELPQVRLVLGTAAAAVGLVAALHWIVLPGDHLWLDQKNPRTESVAALDPAKGAGSRRNAAADRVAGGHPAARGRAGAVKARRGETQKTAPRTAGKPIGSAPSTKQPGAPVVGDPTASGGEGPAAIETPAANQNSGSSPPPPPSAHWSTPGAAAAPGSRGSSGSCPECPGGAEAAGTERPDPATPGAPVRRAFKSSASFSLPLPHTHADTRIEEARVGKSIVPASANQGNPSNRRKRGSS
jgi:hypothetical protein